MPVSGFGPKKYYYQTFGSQELQVTKVRSSEVVSEIIV